MTTEPIAYTYEADYHCPDCTAARFGAECQGTDSEGNEIHAVFPWDEWWDTSDWASETLICSDCGAEMDEVEANPPQPFVASVTEAYLECAAWADAPTDEEDRREDFDGWADEVYDLAEADVKDFLTSNSRDLRDMSAEQIGHDFWLTRNRHGVGFWDRGLGDVGERLTKAAHAYGEQYLYVGDDSKLYLA